MRAVLLVLASVYAACGGKMDSQPSSTDAGVATNSGPLCSQSSCASLVFTMGSTAIDDEQISPPGLFVGGGFIYTSTPTRLVRAPLSGGAVETVVPSAMTWSIVADDVNVYWSSNNAQTTRALFRLPHSGGSPEIVATASAPIPIFVDAHNLYWAQDDTLQTVPSAGSTPTALGAVTGDGVLTSGRMLSGSDCTSLAVPSASGAVVAGYDIVADDTHCYTVQNDVISIPIGGGSTKILAQGAKSGEATAFDGQRMMIDANGIYLRRSDATTGRLIRVPFEGSGPVVDVTTDLALAYEVTNDTIYWATLGNATLVLKSMPKHAP